MSYASNTDVEQRMGTALLVQLTDDAGTGSADEAKVNAVRETAEARLDSFLARRYRVPVDLASHAAAAELLKGLTLDLTEHLLHGRRPPVPEDVRRRHDAAITWLERLASGAVLLPTSTELPGNATAGPVAEVLGAERILSRESLRDL